MFGSRILSVSALAVALVVALSATSNRASASDANVLAASVEVAKVVLAGGEGEGEGEGESECPGDGGDCCIADGTPGCDDIDCCEAICLADPFCCDVAWDSLCSGAAELNAACNEGACDDVETCDAWVCDGDANGDGNVDPLDSGFVLARFGLDPCVEGCAADLNCDGTIDPLDSGYALARFGTCDAPPVCEINCD